MRRACLGLISKVHLSWDLISDATAASIFFFSASYSSFVYPAPSSGPAVLISEMKNSLLDIPDGVEEVEEDEVDEDEDEDDPLGTNDAAEAERVLVDALNFDSLVAQLFAISSVNRFRIIFILCPPRMPNSDGSYRWKVT